MSRKLAMLKPRVQSAATARVATLEHKAGTTPRIRGHAWQAIRRRIATQQQFCCQSCGRAVVRGCRGVIRSITACRLSRAAATMTSTCSFCATTVTRSRRLPKRARAIQAFRAARDLVGVACLLVSLRARTTAACVRQRHRGGRGIASLAFQMAENRPVSHAQKKSPFKRLSVIKQGKSNGWQTQWARGSATGCWSQTEAAKRRNQTGEKSNVGERSRRCAPRRRPQTEGRDDAERGCASTLREESGHGAPGARRCAEAHEGHASSS